MEKRRNYDVDKSKLHCKLPRFQSKPSRERTAARPANKAINAKRLAKQRRLSYFIRHTINPLFATTQHIARFKANASMWPFKKK